MEEIIVKEIKFGTLNLVSYPSYLGMYRLSNIDHFTKWGFFKHLILSTVIPSWKIYGAFVHGKLGGFSFTKNKFLYRLIVDHQFRGKGLGKKLIPVFVNHTETNREEVVTFYTRMGYVVTGKRGKTYLLKKH